MTSITGLVNYSNFSYTLPTNSLTLAFIPQKSYSGYLINQTYDIMTLTIILVDENNKINQLDPIQLGTWTGITFKNLLLYQLIISYPNSGDTITYNIIGTDYIKGLIPEINLNLYLTRDSSGTSIVNIGNGKFDSNGIFYVNTGFTPYIAGGPISADITVPTSIQQLYTAVNNIIPMVILTADSSNTATIFIGGSGQTPVYPLKAGQTIVLWYVNPAAIFGYTTTTGQILHLLIMN